MTKLVKSGTDINNSATGTIVARIVKDKYLLINPSVTLSRDSLLFLAEQLPKPVVQSKIQPPITVNQPATVNQNTTVPNLLGKSVCLTGTVKKLSRTEAFTKMREVGIYPMNTCSTRTALLVVADRPGEEKLNKAQQYNIPTMSWIEFERNYL